MQNATLLSRCDGAVSERELVRQACGGDVESCHALYRHYHPFIYTITLAALQRPVLVELVLLDTFVDAFEALSRLKTGEPFSTWLVRLTACRIMSNIKPGAQLRVARLPPKPAFTKAGNSTAPRAPSRRHGSLGGARLHNLIAAALASLPAIPRAELVLCDLGKLSALDIAVAAATTENAVSLDIHEARICMARALQRCFRQASHAGITRVLGMSPAPASA